MYKELFGALQRIGKTLMLPVALLPVAGLLGGAALTSFLTGITEPLEFTFLCLSPVLIFIYAVLDGLSFVCYDLVRYQYWLHVFRRRH